MATIVLSAAGAALGGAVGGGIAGLQSVAIGRAVGAIAGRVLDDRLLGSGSDAVQVGKVDRFRLNRAGQGAPIPQVFGRMRVGGQMIWASDFLETSKTSGGGKGAPRRPQTTSYSYSVSLAIAVCSGKISSISRVWADGEEIAPETLNMRVYAGSKDQLPDPVIEAIEGAGTVPAYRGTAYVVLEDLGLEAFGNRVPQFSFEVVRPEQPDANERETDLGHIVPAVSLIPGTGEYALATEPVYFQDGPARFRAANVNSPSGQTDFVTSLQQLRNEASGCDSGSLVVSWFGNDLRCGECTIEPRVERASSDGREQPWQVSGLTRVTARELGRIEDRPIYGGTPSDASVVQAIRHMKTNGQRVMFYPFVLMEQMAGNTLPDPWTGITGQPVLPWRGRVTLSVAPGQDGSPDQSAQADDQVAAFFGTARANDFQIGDGVVSYSGPSEWGMRRFILHYAALCAASGGVEVFCIGSEMRGLTQIRGANGFPAVAEMRALAAEVREILGPETNIGYAADWSEYFGYQPPEGGGSLFFHLDPLWADHNIDFVGIDNYMPVSDWRDGEDHLDFHAGWRSVYESQYLSANIEGGEGYDWYYESEAAVQAQIRTPIRDIAYGEDWVWRFKDIRNWWSNPHHDRPNGIRQTEPTAWVPGSKPVYFTELGCAAIDKGTNQPNRFLDAKSSESGLPRFSNGLRDDYLQMQYLKTVLNYWTEPQNNPISDLYEGRMLDMRQAYVWAWDTRPFPYFPNSAELWSDGGNYQSGHWLNGRLGANSLASVVSEICRNAGLQHFDVSRLHGVVRGYLIDDVSDARSALQPLMLRYGFDAIERNGALEFRMRSGLAAFDIHQTDLVETDEISGSLAFNREAEAELTGRVRLRYVEWGGDHEVRAEEAVLPDDATHAVHSTDVPLALTNGEARHVTTRWLAEARVARDSVKFALPPSRSHLGSGDIVRIACDDGAAGLYRIDRLEQSEFQMVEAVRIEPEVYTPADVSETTPPARKFIRPAPVLPHFLDLPLITGDEIPHAPHLAISADPWPGAVATYSSSMDENYRLDQIVSAQATIGQTETALYAAGQAIWDYGDGLQVKLFSGGLETRDKAAILNGANLAAIGDGTSGNWEVFQFTNAELIAPDTYLLSQRLRGQVGSDALIPDVWPEGSIFVLLNGSNVQLDLPSSQRRVARHYRIGPAQRGYDDPSFVHKVEAFDGNGLRPYRPSHLRAVAQNDGAHRFGWIRRTRIDGDSWDMDEVPIGEESERYRLRVVQNNSIVREEMLGVSQWTYPSADRASDGIAGEYSVEVAQMSARYGAGPSGRVQVASA